MFNIDSLPSSKSFISISGRDFKDFTRFLKIGEVLKVKIVNILGDNKYSINVRGFNIVAESEQTLQEGDIIRGEVRTTEPKVLLRLVGDDALVGVMQKQQYAQLLSQASVQPPLGDFLSILEKIFGQSQTVEMLAGFPDMQNLLESLRKVYLGPKNQDSWAKIIKLFFSGKNTGDFVSTLNKMSAMLQDKKFLQMINEGNPSAVMLGNTIKQLLKNIEAQNHLNQNLKEQGLLAYLQLPLQVDKETQTLELKLYHSKKENGKQGYSLQVRTETSVVGELAFIMNIYDKNISTVILAENNQVVSVIKENADNFSKMLLKEGYTLDSLNCVLFNSKEAKKHISEQNVNFFSVRRVDTVA